MEKEFDHEIRISASQARGYFDGDPMGDDFENALDSAQGDAKIKGVAQRILLVVEPDTEEPEGLDEEEGA